MKTQVNLQNIFGLTGIAAVALTTLVGLRTSALAGPGSAYTPRVAPPNSHAHGASYSEWSARWLQWSLSRPATEYPGFTTPDLSAGQSGRVWFLPTAFARPVGNTIRATIQGTVPAGTALFRPVINTWWDNTGCPEWTDFTAEELRALVMESWTAVSQASCVIDGIAVAGLEDPQTTPYRVQSPAFGYTVADHDNMLANVLGYPCIADGTFVAPVVADGIYVMINPLPPGLHTIHFSSTVGPLASPWIKFELTFEITVTPE
jgi:hypothetical protein